MDKFLKFPPSTAEIAGVVLIVLATMAIATRTPIVKKLVG